jgi:hypothetical protein
MIPDHIVRDYCDGCGTQSHKRTLVALLHDHGVPIMTVCRRCSPHGFQSAAQADKDRWLSGSSLSQR